MAGCLYCGTGSGVCSRHARQISSVAQREGRPPRSREQLARGGGQVTVVDELVQELAGLTPLVTRWWLLIVGAVLLVVLQGDLALWT